jgi:flagellar basal body-associated protein FliL
METIIWFILLYVVAFIIIAGVSLVTYFVFFKKYKDKINKTQQTDINKAKPRLKYCLNCGAELNKKNKCEMCGEKY